MTYEDDEPSSPYNYSGAGSTTGNFVDSQQLAQLLVAARAAQQVGQSSALAQNAALQNAGLIQNATAGPQQPAAPASPSAPELRPSVLAPTDPFTAGGGTSGVGARSSQVPAAQANADPAKAAAIQSARQAQANPHGSGAQPQSNPQASPTARKSVDPFPKLETPSAEDIANGDYIVVGFRHLLRQDPTWLGFHTYVGIPVKDENGKITIEHWGVLGNPKNPQDAQIGSCTTKPIPGSGTNQQVRDDCRNDQIKGYEAKEVLVKVSPEQRDALRQGMRYFTEKDENGNFKNPCPVCGDRYHLFGPNSNEFIYNMLFWNPAGPIPAPKPPSRFFTPAYYVNDPNKDWYSKNSR